MGSFRKKQQAVPGFPRQDYFGFLQFHAVFLVRFAFVNKTLRASVFFTVDEVKFIRERAWTRGAYQYWKDRGRRARAKRVLGKGGVNVPA